MLSITGRGTKLRRAENGSRVLGARGQRAHGAASPLPMFLGREQQASLPIS